MSCRFLRTSPTSDCMPEVWEAAACAITFATNPRRESRSWWGLKNEGGIPCEYTYLTNQLTISRNRTRKIRTHNNGEWEYLELMQATMMKDNTDTSKRSRKVQNEMNEAHIHLGMSLIFGVPSQTAKETMRWTYILWTAASHEPICVAAWYIQVAKCKNAKFKQTHAHVVVKVDRCSRNNELICMLAMEGDQSRSQCSQLPTAQPVPQRRKQRWQHLQLQHTTQLLIYPDPLPLASNIPSRTERIPI